MRVLFQAYYDFGRMYGGGPAVVYGLAGELSRLGVEVAFHNYWKDDPRQFDLIHYFSCAEAFHWLRHQAGDPPLVVTPITWYEFPWRQRLKTSMQHWARVLWHRTSDRRRLGDPFVVPAHYFPNSEGEAYHFARACRVPRERMTLVPHGVPERFREGSGELFTATHGVADFVLCVGRFEYPRKNQLALIEALSEEPVPVVFIGGPDAGQQDYYNRCRAAAGKRMVFVDPLRADDPMLISAYHACKVVVMPALLESPGLAGLEGALAGANVACTQNGSTREYFDRHGWYFDPRDRRAIRTAVLEARAAPRQPELRQRVQDLYTWPRIALKQKEAYEHVLARS
jgi:glycosyltransferase involved in cell wall biosynthesis